MYIRKVIRRRLLAATLSALIATGLQAQPGPKPLDPYRSDFARFQALDRKNPPAPGQILFIGSSSFTRWQDVVGYFPGDHILNRAFGGSTLLDQIKHVGQVVFPYRPSQIVIYCGENDLAFDKNLAAYQLAQRFFDLFRIIRSRYPKVPIIYVSMKPSPSRWVLRRKFIAGNRWIEQFLRGQKGCSFVDVWASMLNENGQPKPEIYVADKLHMNARGYRIWQPLIEKALHPSRAG
jgi:lysophospholipase L1-like esterase